MNDCVDPILLGAWLDGQLPPADAAAVEAHVRACAACAAFVDSVGVAGERLRAASPGAAPAGSADRWSAGLRAARDRQVRRLAGWMTAAAALVLAVTLPSALSAPAEARPTAAAGLTDWEAVAVGVEEDAAVPQTQARLIAVDLAMPGDVSPASSDGGAP